MSDMRNVPALLNKRDHGTRLSVISLILCGWIFLKVLKHISYKHASKEWGRHWYSDRIVDHKTIWSNKLAVEELVKIWPRNRECFIYIESHLLTRQLRQRQFLRAQHIGGQGKSWLSLVDMAKLLAGQRKWILKSTYEFINKTGRAGKSKEKSKK